MKATLIAASTLAVAGTASAQSSVLLYGVIDANLTSISQRSADQRTPTFATPIILNQGSVKVSKTFLNSSGYNSSRLGFRGTEDLGGGLSAGFWLEGQVNNDDGTGLGVGGSFNFARRATVSLTGGFGELRIGRDYTPTFWNDTVFDPFGTNGVGTSVVYTANSLNANAGSGVFSPNPNTVRASNSIGYFLPPTLGGFYGQVMYAFDENIKYDPGTQTPPGVNAAGLVNAGAVPSNRAGRYAGGRAGYANGKLDVAVSYGRSNIADNFYAGTTDTLTALSAGASYDFGIVKLFGELSRVTNKRDYANVPLVRVPDIDQSGYNFGATVPVGPGLIRMSYGRVRYDLNVNTLVTPPEPRAEKFALGYVHNLSKRTALYVTAGRVNNKNGAALTVGGLGNPPFINNSVFTPKSSTGYDLGIRHAF